MKKLKIILSQIGRGLRYVGRGLRHVGHWLSYLKYLNPFHYS